jgi:mannitol-specific phosphotransferase system IIBC component
MDFMRTNLVPIAAISGLVALAVGVRWLASSSQKRQQRIDEERRRLREQRARQNMQESIETLANRQQSELESIEIECDAQEVDVHKLATAVRGADVRQSDDNDFAIVEEALMELLLQSDAIDLAALRAKRKQLVARIQSLLEQLDHARLDNESKKSKDD